MGFVESNLLQTLALTTMEKFPRLDLGSLILQFIINLTSLMT